MTWPTFHTQHPVKQLVVRDGDMKLATLAFGWTIGFGYFVVWHAIRQTKRLNAFTVMIWGEILVCAIFAIICWLYLCGVIGYSFWFYFIILTTWALQVQFLLQIIVNRICILLSTPRERFWLKFIIAAWITAINISVYCIWVPAKLQISDQFHDINIWWDRTEKCLYLVTDAILNFMFIRSIKQRLLKVGLKKYDKLVKFNEKIIAVSLAMDVLIITMMSHPNDFVYMQFHPVAYIVKLEIEMCMSKLMIKVATGTGITIYVSERVGWTIGA
ncbi:putative transmembrane protein [Rhizoctonia solani 123E]|uniref:Putative transmembrane protein n=1 Tax=Rhizoctonia solani 123E TaxID=1423351 RepID=A0A074SU32_9AGAM|nr:putative transmembrane protein [Rhizoctonia solani 123E]